MRLFAAILFLVSLLITALFGLLGLAAWFDSRAQCPGGSNCDDATATMIFASIACPLSLLAAVLALWILRR